MKVKKAKKKRGDVFQEEKEGIELGEEKVEEQKKDNLQTSTNVSCTYCHRVFKRGGIRQHSTAAYKGKALSYTQVNNNDDESGSGSRSSGSDVNSSNRDRG